MSKPLGIGLSMESGVPHMFVTPINRVTDLIWDAVQEALCANMTPEQFRREASQAWQHYLREEQKAAESEFLKA